MGVECSCSCIWFMILGYLKIRDTINHLLLTNKSIYYSIMKFKFDDSKQSMIKLLELSPEIKLYLMWISAQKPDALEKYLSLQVDYTDINFLSALQEQFLSIFSIPSIDNVIQIEAIDDTYEFYIGIQTQDMIIYN